LKHAFLFHIGVGIFSTTLLQCRGWRYSENWVIYMRCFIVGHSS
jgi:hypothetical protein